MIVIATIFLLVGVLPGYSEPADDEGSTTISGKIISVGYGRLVPFVGRSATLLIEDSDGKEHTVHVGVKTVYIPHRTPASGDKVSVNCIKNKGLWAATTVTYK
jgi:hypothetical protein